MSAVDPDRPVMTPAQRGRIGGYVAVSRYGADRIAARARRGLLQKFMNEVDPEHKLTDQERRIRARARLRAHMTKVSAAGVAARRKKEARRQAQQERASGGAPAASSVRDEP